MMMSGPSSDSGSSIVYFTHTSSASMAFTSPSSPRNTSSSTSFPTMTTMPDGTGGPSTVSMFQSSFDVTGSSTMQPPQKSGDYQQLSVAYTASEGIVSLLAIFGNALVVYVFCTNRSLRRYRNYYIFALAIADFLVGLLGIPFAVLSSIGLPRNLYGCLFTVSILMVLCTISILCLVAVSIDRYWATTNPFAYYRHMTTSTAVGIILSCWIVGAIIGFLPLFGWYNQQGWLHIAKGSCYFRQVMDYNYLVFLYFATIVFPAILMGCFYGYIYHVVLIKIRQKGNLAPQLRRPSEQSRSGSLNSDNRGASQILRIVVSEKRREAKAAHKLGIIVLFFMICWMPLYTINCITAFFPDTKFSTQVLNFTVILSHANSSLNPLLYAYHLKEFRGAMKNALLQLFEKLLCGLMGGRLTKDGGTGPLSRSHTLPSIAAAATTTSSSGRICTKLRRSSPSNIGKDTSSASRSIQISPRQGLIMSNSSRDHPHNLTINTTTTTSTEKSFTSLSSEENIRSFGVAFQDEFHNQISTGKEIEPDVELVDSAKNSNIEQNQHQQADQTVTTTTSQNRISHGIEIHVVNEDGEVGGGGDGEEDVGGKSEKKAVHQTTEVDDRNGNILAAETTNELDAITRASES